MFHHMQLIKTLFCFAEFVVLGTLGVAYSFVTEAFFTFSLENSLFSMCTCCMNTELEQNFTSNNGKNFSNYGALYLNQSILIL